MGPQSKRRVCFDDAEQLAHWQSAFATSAGATLQLLASVSYHSSRRGERVRKADETRATEYAEVARQAESLAWALLQQLEPDRHVYSDASGDLTELGADSLLASVSGRALIAKAVPWQRSSSATPTCRLAI